MMINPCVAKHDHERKLALLFHQSNVDHHNSKWPRMNINNDSRLWQYPPSHSSISEKFNEYLSCDEVDDNFELSRRT